MWKFFSKVPVAMQPSQPDRRVSIIYNNLIGKGRAATDPSLDHFWRVLFGHFSETVVKFIKKAFTKSTSKLVPMANSLAFWRRAIPRVGCPGGGQSARLFAIGSSLEVELVGGFSQTASCCGSSLTKEAWRGGDLRRGAEISGIGYNTRGRVRGAG